MLFRSDVADGGIDDDHSGILISTCQTERARSDILFGRRVGKVPAVGRVAAASVVAFRTVAQMSNRGRGCMQLSASPFESWESLVERGGVEDANALGGAVCARQVSVSVAVIRGRRCECKRCYAMRVRVGDLQASWVGTAMTSESHRRGGNGVGRSEIQVAQE